MLAPGPNALGRMGGPANGTGRTLVGNSAWVSLDGLSFGAA